MRDQREMTTTPDFDPTTITSDLGATDPAKPGFKTSEFWLKVAAMVLTAAYASGALTSNTALAIAGIAATILGALGYTVSRTMIKAAA